MKYIVCEWKLKDCPAFHNIIYDNLNSAINKAIEIGVNRSTVYVIKECQFVSREESSK